MSLARQTAPYVEGFKVGPRLFFKSSRQFVPRLKKYGRVFLDFKFFDIPSSVVAAVQAAWDQGADLTTVHAHNGADTLRLLASLQLRLKAKRDFRILVVTVLTSFTRSLLPAFLKPFSLPLQVESLADFSVRQGLNSLVCSAEEVGILRKRHPQAYLLTPGIRLVESPDGDQKRVKTAPQALKAGASALVMGRPVYQAPDPVKVCVQLQESLKNL